MVDTSAAIRRGHPIIFILFTALSFITAVIASTLVSDYNSNNNAPSDGVNGAVRFLVFCGWWGFLFGILFTVFFLTGKGGILTSIAGHGIWIFLTWLFFVAGAGALTNNVDGSCGNRGPSFPYCNSVKALEAFSWMAWIILTLMLGIVAFVGAGSFRGGRSVKEGLA
ncbi:uncharacterized protein PFL1_03961 [Pseudozyma flocculosa PF-1]|uniref:MARVEL domain-containing protein n=2 Tax=Pseudozyma flocculosa TaxID=84751 RepID=A0A5C3EXV6_9BASI|nr:uncharacterized protein PFL1_03961 [Pseudozyma flocculosa PF-1]EPQ28658.1 hypothetical protein PFL1_03961 [Pseudozyma flocculosa PF-1]SPO36605.1 uncharacterized protein PSFLO_02076 [Pseudozyma flocculosa]